MARLLQRAKRIAGAGRQAPKRCNWKLVKEGIYDGAIAKQDHKLFASNAKYVASPSYCWGYVHGWGKSRNGYRVYRGWVDDAAAQDGGGDRRCIVE